MNYQPIQAIYDWEVGKHGIELTVNLQQTEVRHHCLPETAYDNEWNQESTIKYLAQKAGYFGDIDETVDFIH